MILETTLTEGIPIQKNIPPLSEHLNLKCKTKDFPNVLILTKNGQACIWEKDILYAKAMGSYTKLYLVSGKQYMSSKKLKEVEKVLSSPLFFRIHHSHLINLYHLKTIRNQQSNLVLLTDGTELEISKRKRGAFYAIFSRL